MERLKRGLWFGERWPEKILREMQNIYGMIIQFFLTKEKLINTCGSYISIQRDNWRYFTSGVRQIKNSLLWDVVDTRSTSGVTKRPIKFL